MNLHKGRGWFGNSKAHSQAGKKGGASGKKGKGWFGNSKAHALAGRRGGKAKKQIHI